MGTYPVAHLNQTPNTEHRIMAVRLRVIRSVAEREIAQTDS